jgi:hypothetical protein
MFVAEGGAYGALDKGRFWFVKDVKNRDYR